MEADESRRRREHMIRSQIACRGIWDSRVLDAMRQIPRERFVPPEREDEAYWDGALSIGLGQTISQPYIVALMTQALELTGDEVVLEVGTGSGYQAAILCCLCRWVYTIERLQPLAEAAAQRLAEQGIENVTVLVGDGSLGFEQEAPYEGIIVTAASPRVPQALREQLADGGRLVIPLGDRSHQVLYQMRRRGDEFRQTFLCDCIFVPLLGADGWEEE